MQFFSFKPREGDCHGYQSSILPIGPPKPDEAVAVVLHDVIAGRPNDDSFIHFGDLEERLMREAFQRVWSQCGSPATSACKQPRTSITPRICSMPWRMALASPTTSLLLAVSFGQK